MYVISDRSQILGKNRLKCHDNQIVEDYKNHSIHSYNILDLFFCLLYSIQLGCMGFHS